ncbi:putative drug exporter of the RND superfamily [Terriglobus roseus]|uniref:Putative drug exporter of the RND superfamily n=2 Tax=Terriglobus roseus TaxID=392734 RepID=A0A1G7JDR9_9BACT|nr:putative drug exporter of the RND superfamily [Terriglobus roseus]
MMGSMHMRRFWVAGIVLAAALVLLPFSFHAERSLETATRVEGSQADTVRNELADRFHSPFVDQVVLVVQGLPSADSAEGAQTLEPIVTGLKAQPGVSGVVSYLDLHDPVFLGRGGGTYVLIGLSSADGPVESLVPGLHQLASSLQDKLKAHYPAIKLQLSGEIPLNFDIRKASADDVRRGESLVIPATLALLLVAFGSLVAALIPLAIGELAIATTLAITGFLAHRWHLSILVQNLATMLGLGLGIDYGLLMVSRFREAISSGLNGSEAANVAARQAGKTLIISASTVGIGFLALLTVPISEIRSIGIAGCVVASLSVLLTNTLVPALLSLLGPRIDLGKMPFTPKLDSHRAECIGVRWRLWGQVIVAHPWIALVLAGIPLLLLAMQVRHLDTSVPEGDWLPQSAESVQALHALEHMDRGGIVESLRIIVEFPKDSIAQSDTAWNALDNMTKRLEKDQRADRVISLTTIAESNRASLPELSRETRRTLLSSDGHAALIQVLPKGAVTLREQVDWVRELRKTGAPALTGVPGTTMLVGGIPALNADYETIIRDRFPSVMALVVGGTFLALLCGFRSIFVAVKAIALNLVSVAAAFGALIIVFQHGYGSRFLGVPGGTGSIFPLVPIVTFAIVFGLSMDYEVFLVARVLEARRSGLNEVEAIPEGMARTAGLITSAAAIMIVVFAAFTFGGFLVVKMIGFTLAVAVLIDATIVRIVVGPALLRLAGDWNWWPGGLATKPIDSHLLDKS